MLEKWDGKLAVGRDSGKGKCREGGHRKLALVGKGSQGAGFLVAWLPHARGVEFTESLRLEKTSEITEPNL